MGFFDNTRKSTGLGGKVMVSMIDLFDNPTLAYQIGDVSRRFD